MWRLPYFPCLELTIVISLTLLVLACEEVRVVFGNVFGVVCVVFCVLCFVFCVVK